VIEFGLGLTDLVKRPTNSAADVRGDEFATGRQVLADKIIRVQPLIVCFNGLRLSAVLSGTHATGRQTRCLHGALVYVLPSTERAERRLFTSRRSGILPRFMRPARRIAQSTGTLGEIAMDLQQITRARETILCQSHRGRLRHHALLLPRHFAERVHRLCHALHGLGIEVTGWPS
jgi:hypothetical protein